MLAKKSHLMIVLIFALGTLSGCFQQKKVDEVPTKSESQKFSNVRMEMTTIKIPIDSVSSHTFFRFNTFESKGQTMLVIYNSYIHALQFYNVGLRKLEKNIELDLNGPNGMANLDGFYVHNMDTIFVFDSGHLRLMNERGVVYDKIKLFNERPKDAGTIYPTYLFKPIYFSKHKTLAINHMHRMHDKDALKRSFISFYSLKDRRLKLGNAYYSEYYKEGGAFGLYSYANVNKIDEDRVVYNFMVEPNIYTHDITSDVSKSYFGKVESINNYMNPLPPNPSQDQLNKHRVSSAMFYEVLYDPYRSLYYRVHKEGKTFEDWDTNSIFNTHFYISVFDDELNFIKEFKLPKDTYSQITWFVTREGFCMNAAFSSFEGIEESKITLHCYQFTPSNE